MNYLLQHNHCISWIYLKGENKYLPLTIVDYNYIICIIRDWNNSQYPPYYILVYIFYLLLLCYIILVIIYKSDYTYSTPLLIWKWPCLRSTVVPLLRTSPTTFRTTLSSTPSHLPAPLLSWSMLGQLCLASMPSARSWEWTKWTTRLAPLVPCMEPSSMAPLPPRTLRLRDCFSWYQTFTKLRQSICQLYSTLPAELSQPTPCPSTVTTPTSWLAGRLVSPSC